jgi:mannosyltransferase
VLSWPWLALLLAAFALRVEGIARESFWRDEVDAVVFAQVPWPELFGAFGRPQHNGPLYHVALRLWTDAVGTSELAVRYFSTLGDLLALCFVVAAARRLGGWPLPALVGVLWALLPGSIWYAQEAKMYAWLAAGAAACLWLCLPHPGGRTIARRAAAVALAAGALYLHYFSLLLVLPAGALLAASLARLRSRVGTRSTAPEWRFGAGFLDAVGGRAGLTAIAAGLMVVLLAAGTLPREWDTLFAPRPTGHPFVPIGELPLRTLFGVLLNVPPLSSPLAVALLVVPLAASALPLRGEPIRAALERVGLLWLFVLVPLAAFYVVSLSLPLFAERYFVILTPALCLLMARGVGALAGRARLLGAAVGVPLLLLCAYVAVSHQTTADKADYRALGAHLRAHAQPGDALMVVMPYNERSVQFYAGPSPPLVDPPAAPPGVGAAELEHAAAARLAGRGRLWLVRAEPEQWDPTDAIAGWLAGRAGGRASFAWRGLRLDLFDLS